MQKLRQITKGDFNLSVKSFIESPLIRTIETKEIAPIIATYIDKADRAYSGSPSMTMDAITALSYDLIELMSYEAVEDVAMMFKLFRQGKLTQDTFKPFKKFDSFNVCNVLVPKYLEHIGNEKAKIREVQNKETKKNGLRVAAERISHLKLNDNMVEEMTKTELVQEPVNEQFKRSVDGLDLENAQMLLETYRGYPALKDRRAYLNRAINERLNSNKGEGERNGLHG